MPPLGTCFCRYDKLLHFSHPTSDNVVKAGQGMRPVHVETVHTILNTPYNRLQRSQMPKEIIDAFNVKVELSSVQSVYLQTKLRIKTSEILLTN